MKKTILFTALSIFAFNLNANIKTNPSKEAELLIQNSLSQTTLTNDRVEVLFSTDEQGKVNFVLAKTNDINLKKKIEERFLALHFKNLQNNAVNSVTLHFKSI